MKTLALGLILYILAFLSWSVAEPHGSDNLAAQKRLEELKIMGLGEAHPKMLQLEQSGHEVETQAVNSPENKESSPDEEFKIEILGNVKKAAGILVVVPRSADKMEEDKATRRIYSILSKSSLRSKTFAIYPKRTGILVAVDYESLSLFVKELHRSGQNYGIQVGTVDGFDEDEGDE